MSSVCNPLCSAILPLCRKSITYCHSIFTEKRKSN